MVETVKNSWVQVANVKDLSPGTPRIVDVNGLRVAVFKIEGKESGIYAMEDVCTHDDGPVAEGSLEGFVIECPRHGARFDIRTGAVLSMPAVMPVRTFPARVNGEHIEIEIPE